MENISYEDWAKIVLKVGIIKEAQDIKGADRLYKLIVDLGEETRELVAGLKSNYTKEELQNKKCIVFTNLEPKTLRGIQSKGMVLAAVNDDENKVCLLEPDKEIKVGSIIS